MAEIEKWLRETVFAGEEFSYPDAGAGKRGRFSVCCRLESQARLRGRGASELGEAKPELGRYVLKRSVMQEMEARSGDKWNRDVLSFRAEFAVYAFLCPPRPREGCAPQGARLWPEAYAQMLHGFAPFEAPAGDGEASPAADFKPAPDSRMAMVLEDLEAQDYVQKGELSALELQATVVALASFHAAGLPMAAAARRGGRDGDGEAARCARDVWPLASFFTRDKRGGQANFAKELAVMDARWRAFLANWPELLETPAVSRELGARLSRHGAAIADVVGELPRSVLAHGDGKTANMFFHATAFESFAKSVAAGGKCLSCGPSPVPVRWIDFQWSGFGSPLLDIVYLVVSSARILDEEFPPTSDVEVGALLRGYYTALALAAEAAAEAAPPTPALADGAAPRPAGEDGAALLGADAKLPGASAQEREAWLSARVREYKFVFLDYARVVVSYMWDGTLNADVIAKRAGSINFCIHNRSAAHVGWLARTMQRYMDDLGLA